MPRSEMIHTFVKFHVGYEVNEPIHTQSNYIPTIVYYFYSERDITVTVGGSDGDNNVRSGDIRIRTATRYWQFQLQRGETVNAIDEAM